MLQKTEIFRKVQGLHAGLTRLGVRQLGVFGSVVRGDNREGSDIDFLVDFAPESVKFDNFMALHDLLEATLRCKIDLVTLGALSPYLGPHILKEVEHIDLAS